MNTVQTSDPMIRRRDAHGRRRGRRARHWPILLGLIVISTTLPGCATMAVKAAFGPIPTSELPEVRKYEWAGRRGDTIVVAYTVRDGRRPAARWTAIDLRHATLSPGLDAPRVALLIAHLGAVPNAESVRRLPLRPLPELLPGQEPKNRELSPPADGAELVVYARPGMIPELVVVMVDATGGVRSGSWAVPLPSQPFPSGDSWPMTLARVVVYPIAGSVDLVTWPLQLLLGVVGILRVH
jgi:hypothetical protein